MEVMDTHSTVNIKRFYCGPHGIPLRGLLGKMVDVQAWYQGNKRSLYFTHKGRCGLGLLCNHWKLQVGDEVLVPAYNCGTEIDPFVHYRLNVIFYKVDQLANIDFEDLLQRVTRRTKVIYVTHYFGWPQDIKTLSDYCRRNKIYLVEDCALSLFSNPIQHPIDVLGDAAIFSFPKTLPVPDGGALTISGDEPLTKPLMESPPTEVVMKEMLPFIKRAVLQIAERIGLYGYLSQCLLQSRGGRKSATSMTPAGFPEMPMPYYYDHNIENMTASTITRYILRRTCPESVIQKRRQNYFQLYKAVEKSKLFRPLYQNLPEGVCPLCLPVFVENRERVCLRLNGMGIAAVQWWAGFHRAFDWAEFPEARYLKEHLLAMPIHQQLTDEKMNYIANQISQIDAEI
jgi:perosamine synthetase